MSEPEKKSARHEVVKKVTFALTAAAVIWVMACAGHAAKKDEKDPEDLPTEEEAAASPTPVLSNLPLPESAGLPHPVGYDIGDLVAVFYAKGAPERASLKDCDGDFLKLQSRVQSQDEFVKGVAELVKRDPTGYHWCFYDRLLRIEGAMQSDQYIDEKQKAVLDGFAFCSPVARGFMTELKDSRYMRWAVRRYRHASEWVFHRRLDLNAPTTAELVESADPFEGWREPAESKTTSVLEKYGLVQPSPTPTPTPSPKIN